MFVDDPARAATRMQSKDPRTGEPVLSFPAMARDDVDAACARARIAQTSLASSSTSARARMLREVRAALLARADELVAMLVRETGKTRAEAILLDIAPAAHTLTWVAHAGPRALAPRDVEPFVGALPRRATLHSRPRGVVALITPWNYPLAIPFATLAAAWMAGNSVVWKPSEHATACALLVQDILRATVRDLPDDALVVVTGDGGSARHLLEAAVDHVTFVGSTPVAREVAATCGRRLLPCVIEAGGKAPAIVLRDADVERTARALVFGGFANLGQSCIAIERVFVEAPVAAPLWSALRAALVQLRPDAELGAMVLRRDTERLVRDVDDVIARGAPHMHGASHHGIAPTVVDVTGLDTPLLHDECFGPVLPFVIVPSADEAIDAANAHPQQLNACVFGRDDARVDAVVRRLRAPNVVVNDAMVNYALPELPFGGAGASGFGRVHGLEGLRALVDEQVVVRGHLPVAREPWWQPWDRAPDLALATLRTMSRVLDRLRR